MGLNNQRDGALHFMLPMWGAAKLGRRRGLFEKTPMVTGAFCT